MCRVTVIAIQRIGMASINGTGVVHGAGISITAWANRENMGTTGLTVTGIGCALISVIAVDGFHVALPKNTFLVHRAKAVVRAVRVVVDVNAAKLFRIAGVVRTNIPVVAVQGYTHTACCLALISDCTCTSILARTSNRRISASCLRVALVEGADISVVAVNQGGYTSPLDTGLGCRAGIVIRTGEFIEGIQAPRIGITGIICADISIVAVYFFPDAFAVDAGVVLRAFRVIVTRIDIRCVLTSILIACIVCTRVVIVTLQFGHHTDSTQTGVSNRTGKTIVAWCCVGVVQAFPGGGIAAVVRAGIAVIAVLRGSCTSTVHTGIYNGAYIPVIAHIVVVGEHASGFGVAGIVGTDIIVVAIHNLYHADTVCTGVVEGAGVVVVAGNRIGNECTSILGIARVCGAHIGVIAGFFLSNTFLVGTDVVDGACIPIITTVDIRIIAASCCGITGIVRTGIAIVAIHLLNKAISAVTHIVFCALVSIIAIQSIRSPDTAHVTATGVVGAGVPVVTRVFLSRTSLGRTGILDGTHIPVITRGSARGLFDSTDAVDAFGNHTNFRGGAIVI